MSKVYNILREACGPQVTRNDPILPRHPSCIDTYDHLVTFEDSSDGDLLYGCRQYTIMSVCRLYLSLPLPLYSDLAKPAASLIWEYESASAA